MSEEYYKRWSAAIVQPEHIGVTSRNEISINLEKYCRFIDMVAAAGASAKMKGEEGFAPVKLVAFPEFFLQGWSFTADFEKHKKDILIEIPGEETERLGEKAKENGIYIAGAALEYDKNFPNTILNCGFLIGPSGDVIHKYHKFNVAIHFELSSSPFDVFDKYIEIYGENKSLLDTFFPVTDTPLGKIGMFICMDGHYPEVARALAMNGAEILIRPTAFPEPLVSPPMDTWEMENRSAAYFNLTYVIAPNTGAIISDFPKYFCPGDSMVVDFNGMIIGRAPYPGETFFSSVINVQLLRERRADASRNFPSQLKTEVFREVYKDSIYPKNLLLEKPISSLKETGRRASTPVINQFYKKGIYVKP